MSWGRRESNSGFVRAPKGANSYVHMPLDDDRSADSGFRNLADVEPNLVEFGTTLTGQTLVAPLHIWVEIGQRRAKVGRCWDNVGRCWSTSAGPKPGQIWPGPCLADAGPESADPNVGGLRAASADVGRGRADFGRIWAEAGRYFCRDGANFAQVLAHFGETRRAFPEIAQLRNYAKQRRICGPNAARCLEVRPSGSFSVFRNCVFPKCRVSGPKYLAVYPPCALLAPGG